MATLIDPREEVANAPLSRFHWKFVALMVLIMFFDGYDLFNAAYVIPLVRKTWNPSPELIGWMLSSGIVGLSIGSVLQGLLADRIGRRKVMLLSLWLLTGCTVLLATVVNTPHSFAFFRLLLGAALGMIAPLIITYLNEFAPTRYANRFAMWTFQLGLSAGGICAGLAGIGLATTHGWQMLYVLGSLSIVVVIMATAWLPESIAYLSLRGQTAQVRAQLSLLRPDRAAVYRDAEFKPPTQAVRASVKAVLAPPYRRNTWVHWTVGTLSLFCVHGLTGWLPTIVVQQGAAVSSAFAYGSLIMLAALFGGFGMGWLADRLGSRVRAMVLGYFLAACTVAALGLSGAGPFTVVWVAAAGFFVFGAQGVLNNFQAMSYDTEIRSTGVGIAIGLNRIGGMAGPAVIGLVMGSGAGAGAVYTVIALALLLAAAIISLGRTWPAVPGSASPQAAPLGSAPAGMKHG